MTFGFFGHFGLLSVICLPIILSSILLLCTFSAYHTSRYIRWAMLSELLATVRSKFQAKRGHNKAGGASKTNDSHSRASSSVFMANPTFFAPTESLDQEMNNDDSDEHAATASPMLSEDYLAVTGACVDECVTPIAGNTVVFGDDNVGATDDEHTQHTTLDLFIEPGSSSPADSTARDDADLTVLPLSSETDVGWVDEILSI
jgi:hypothetical protein